jgi:hypothetical protein
MLAGTVILYGRQSDCDVLAIKQKKGDEPKAHLLEVTENMLL